MAEEDTALFAVKNAFYLGAYASCIDEAADMEGLSDSKQIEKDCYVYRSHIALGHAEVGHLHP